MTPGAPFTRRILLATVIAPAFLRCFEEAPPRRGPFAFSYRPSLGSDALAWYSRFDLLVTHDPLPRDQAERLRGAGTKLLLYEWAVAFYESRATAWQRSLREREGTLLNSVPLTGGAGSAGAGAWYFDPAAPDHARERAAEIAGRIAAIGYDGVFFDTTTVENVHPDARRAYERRHPEAAYDAAFSRFLAQLRKAMPAGVIFTNQGYRSAEHYLPYADWDLTESLITWSRGGRHRVRPWNDPADPWNSIHVLMRNVVEPMAARHPGVRFAHLNYIDEADAQTVRLVVALSQIFGGEGFVAAPAVENEFDAVYFRDPGRPRGKAIDLAGGMAVCRAFEHSVIAVTAATAPVVIPGLGSDVRNRVTGERVCGDAIALPPSGGEPRAHFFDRTRGCRTAR